ncbi:MAG: hypothetical protein PHY56_07730, partial [Candidatus Omnitrophica bacterium]|nr:hypothetical protein [Candidatus Omnitrophota bacterium]
SRFAITRFISLLAIHFIVSSLIYYLMGFGFVYFQPYRLNLNTSPDGCLDLFNPFRFFPYRSPDFPIELPLGLSISAFIVGMIAFIKKNGLARLILINLLFFMVIAAGPYLIHNGKLVYILGHRIILPFYFLSKYLPLSAGIFYPMRVFPFINICLAILAGYGLIYLSSIFKKFRPVYIAGVFSLIYLLENLILFSGIFPPKITSIYIPAFYQGIRGENFSAVLNLPINPDQRTHNRYGYYTFLSGKKMMNRYWGDGLPVYLPDNSDDKRMQQAFIDKLSQWGVGYIVIFNELLPPEDANAPAGEKWSWLGYFCKPDYYQNDNLLAYRLPRKVL